MAVIFPLRTVVVQSGVVADPTNIAVNGSVTPVQFNMVPPPGQVFNIRSVGIALATNGNVNEYLTKFMGRSALTNGIDVVQRINGQVETRLGVVKSNKDLTLFFTTNFAQKSFGNTTVVAGLIDAGEVVFDSRTADFYRIVINDDLSTMLHGALVLAGSRIIL